MSGIAFVRALFDYEYEADGGDFVSFQQGDQFKLLEKSTNEWWKVQTGLESDPFYVPANYVEEIVNGRPAESDDSGIANSPHDPIDQSSNSCDLTSDSEENLVDAIISEENANSKPNEPIYANIHINVQETLIEDVTEVSGTDEPSREVDELCGWRPQIIPRPPPKIREGQNDHEEPETTENEMHSNPSNLHSTFSESSCKPSEQKPPKPDDIVRPLRKLNLDWEVHRDSSTGREFYFNRLTGDTSWTAPRSLQKINKALLDPSNLTNLVRHSSNRQSLPVCKPTPPGWRSLLEDGQLVYTNTITQERWRSSMDVSGRLYYFRENGGESAWGLPDMSDFLSGSYETSNIFNSRLQDSSQSGSNTFTSCAGVAFVESSDSTNPFTHHQATPALTNQLFPRPYSVGAAEKKGLLNRAKICENGKKMRKNWTQSYVVTSSIKLLFYRDEKAHKNSRKPEMVINLAGATVDFGCKDAKSSKKNVLQVTTSSETIILLQSDDPIKIHSWYITLSHNASTTDPPSPAHSLDDSMDSIDSVESLSSPQTSRWRRRSRRTDQISKRNIKSSNNFNKISSSSVKSQMPPPKYEKYSLKKACSLEDLDRHSSIRDILKNLFIRRPPLESLQEQGIIKDRVFGAEIGSLCARESSDVPLFIKKVVKEIEGRGLDTDGLYRVSGNLAQVQKLRCIVDQNEEYELGLWEVHVLTGSLKLFFRELKEPLIPFDQFDEFMSLVEQSNGDDRKFSFQQAISKLPAANRKTLWFLSSHLIRVVEHKLANRMQIQNLAIVFGPTLMRPREETSNVAVTAVCQNTVIEFILLHHMSLF